MLLAFVGLGIVSLLELLLWTPLGWKTRRFSAKLLIVLLLCASGFLLGERLAAWTVLVMILSLYRVLNLARIVANRIQEDYLFHASRQTALWLVGSQLCVIVLAAAGSYYGVEPIRWWEALAVVQLTCGAILLASTLRHLRTSRKPALAHEIPVQNLPSLTVAIPARNETTELEECLRSLIASTYPKLEIVVLDDCSQNKRTPEIIRDFAHNGVRFIAGTPPPGQWLAKNHAYAQLAAEANGELLLFCGVDTRFEPESLTVFVRTLLEKKKQMASVLPLNLLPRKRSILSLFLQPSRYAWELALPRRILERPPVLSTCWLISRQALKDAGGFQAAKRKGVPESYFARETANREDGYSFIFADTDLAISSEKSLESQKATSIRTRYLQLHRRPELTAVVGLAELSLLVWPLIVFVVAAVAGQQLLALLAGLGFVFQTIVYWKIVNLTYRRFTFQGFWLLPFAALYDIGLLNYSMWLYEFDEVLWKGRNVCMPVMRIVPKLPGPTSGSE